MTRSDRSSSKAIAERIRQKLAEGEQTTPRNPIDALVDGLAQTPESELIEEERTDIANRRRAVQRGINELGMNADALLIDDRKSVVAAASRALSSVEYAEEEHLRDTGAGDDELRRARNRADSLRTTLQSIVHHPPGSEPELDAPSNTTPIIGGGGSAADSDLQAFMYFLLFVLLGVGCFVAYLHLHSADVTRLNNPVTSNIPPPSDVEGVDATTRPPPDRADPPENRTRRGGGKAVEPFDLRDCPNVSYEWQLESGCPIEDAIHAVPQPAPTKSSRRRKPAGAFDLNDCPNVSYE